MKSFENEDKSIESHNKDTITRNRLINYLRQKDNNIEHWVKHLVAEFEELRRKDSKEMA